MDHQVAAAGYCIGCGPIAKVHVAAAVRNEHCRPVAKWVVPMRQIENSTQSRIDRRPGRNQFRMIVRLTAIAVIASPAGPSTLEEHQELLGRAASHVEVIRRPLCADGFAARPELIPSILQVTNCRQRGGLRPSVSLCGAMPLVRGAYQNHQS